MIPDSSAGRGTQRGAAAGVESVLADDGVQYASPQPLLPRVRIVTVADCPEHTIEDIPRSFQHGSGNGAVGVVAVHIAADATAAEERPGDKRWHHPRRQPLAVVRATNHLIDGRTAAAGLAVRRFGCERTRSAVEMCVDAGLVASHLIDLPHDEQLIRQWLERFQNAVEPLSLQRSRDPQPEKNVEGPDGNRRRRSAGRRAGEHHFFKQWKADGHSSGALQNGAPMQQWSHG